MSKKQYTIYNNSGVSLLYVLAALIVTGFVGMAIVRLCASDLMENACYSTSATARSAAKSGTIAAIHTLQDENNLTTNITFLQEWIDNKTNSPVTITEHSSVTGSDISYSAELLSFDTSNFNVTIRTKGMGKGDSKASAVSVYHLDGLAYHQKYDWSDENALYLGDGISLNTHGEFDINGNVYIGQGNFLHFDGNIKTSHFRKNFIMAKAPDATANFRISAGAFAPVYIRFHENAYFGARPIMDGGVNLYCLRNSGYEYGAQMDGAGNHIGSAYNSYWNGDANTPYSGAGEVIGHYGHMYCYGYTGSSHTITDGYHGYHHQMSAMNIPAQLGLSTEQCQFDVDPSAIPASCITKWTTGGVTFTEDNANTLYNSPSVKKWNDFLVVQLEETMLLGSNGGTFNGKMIILVNGQTIQPISTGKVFDCASDANFTIINNNGGTVFNFGGWDFYRGFLWCGVGGTLTVGGAGVEVKNIKGAIHSVEGTSSMDWYPDSATTTIEYDPTVLEELDYGGFLSKTNCDDNAAIATSRLIAPTGKISAQLVSHAM